jgi:type II secretory pathway pseudopilin PulG
MDVNPYQSPDTAQPTERPRYAIRSWLIELLAVLGIIAILIALLLPAVRSSGESRRRLRCNNNLKQIAIALQNYERDFGCLPPAYTVDANGRPLHSWRTLILPYIEQQALYDTIDLSKPWDDPANKEACDSYISIYDCPSHDNIEEERAKTVYLAVVAPGGCFQPAYGRALQEITDNHGLTLTVVEVDSGHAVPWMSPSDADAALILSLGQSDKLLHRSVWQAAYVDGRTRSMSQETPPAALRAMISVAGNDDAVAETGN